MNKIIFLDMDGVVNGHRQFDNGYYGTSHDCIFHLNNILYVVPEACIVLSSAWRYMILKGEMTLKGFEYLMLTHGIDCRNRLIGTTREDGPMPENADYWWGVAERKQQIYEYIGQNDIVNYVILDDLPLDMDNFVKTDGKVGLTANLAKKTIGILQC